MLRVEPWSSWFSATSTIHSPSPNAAHHERRPEEGFGPASLSAQRAFRVAQETGVIDVAVSGLGRSDAAEKVGFTAPSVAGQAAVIAAAQRAAGVTPDTVTFIEAHGTGTALGDPIEVAALRQVWDAHGATTPCALGSVKTNIFHL